MEIQSKRGFSSNSGNAILESVLTLPVQVILIGGFFVSTYLLFAHFCLNYRTHEDVICAAEEQTIDTCELQSRIWISHVLPFGKIRKVSIRRTSDHYAAWIEVDVLPAIPIISNRPIRLRREHWLTRDELLGRK